MSHRPEGAASDKILSPEAIRALNEAADRRRAIDGADPLPPEKGGQAGPEPTRYGDWERKGLISDF
jgi:hypothetical protein